MAARAEEIQPGRFEAVIGLMLESLKTIFVESVAVVRRPRIDVVGVGELELAFALTYKTGGRRRRWWIECERPAPPEARYTNAGSREAVMRLIAAQPSPADCRLIFLHHLQRTLADDLRRTLEGEGIDHYSLKEFGIRLDEINIALAEDSGLDKTLFRLELMKSSRQFPALRAAFSTMRVTR